MVAHWRHLCEHNGGGNAMISMMQSTETAAQTAVAAPAVPAFRAVAGLDPAEPLAVLVRSTAELNWKPVVQQLLSSWATTGVAPDCTDTAVAADSIVAQEAIETLPIVIASDGARAQRGEALVRTVTPWCGADRRINVLIFFQNGQSHGLNLSVGGTMTGPRLYMDILQQTTPRLIPVLDAMRPSCVAKFPTAAGRLTDTVMTSMTGDAANPSAWSERWTWTICGRDTPVDFVMTAQLDGSTRFEMTAKKP